MDPPPPPANAPAPATATSLHHHPLSYAGSVESSPRSRNNDSWEEPVGAGAGASGGRLRLMCSYGGHIVPRPHDKSLCYVGGETRIVVADRNSSLADLSAKLAKTLLGGRVFTLKYQLPSEDLDSLISVTTDEDLDNMVDEYDRTRPSRLRLFLFAAKPESSQSIGPILDNPAKSEDWFLNALNGAAGGLLNRGFSDSASVNCLLGLDDDAGIGIGRNSNSNSNSGNLDPSRETTQKNSVSAKQGNFQDVHSVPDSPMMETSSSFGSTSSSPSLANLPPIRVHVEDGGGVAIRAAQDQKVGMIEEQFAQMSVAPTVFNRQDDSNGFVALSSPLSAAMVSSSSSSLAAPANRVVAGEEDRSELIGYRKQPPQAKHSDLPSPDSVSSDSSFGNAIPRQKPVVYHQEPIAQIPANRISQPVVTDAKPGNISDANSGYLLHQQFDPKHQTQLQSQSQTQTQQQQQQQQQQFLHNGAHYMHHHHQQSVPISAGYFPVYSSQPQHHHHQMDQQFPVYYLPARHVAPPQQPSPPNVPTTAPANYNQVRTAQLGGNSDISPQQPPAGMYRTATTVAPTGQQFVSYSHLHHQQPNPTVNYSYEYADPSHAQIYFTQPMAPTAMAAHFQTLTEEKKQSR